MTEKEICEAGGIFFENIAEGFERCDYEILELAGREAEAFLVSLLVDSGEDGAYADFYYGRLGGESRAVVDGVLDENERRYLRGLEGEGKGLFVPLTRELISLYVKLNEQEILFSSFYFLGVRCTVWGNYSKQYIVFRDKG